jgi:hypothetical protein
LFIEANILNVPTSFVSTVRLLVQYGAEGEVLATADVVVTGVYRYARVLVFDSIDIYICVCVVVVVWSI